MILEIFILILTVTFLALISLYWTRFRHTRWDRHYPKIAWARAGIYFCFCYLLSYLSGTMEILFNAPVWLAAQWQNPLWLAYTGLALFYILFAYAGVWAYFTPVFDRPRQWLMPLLFGLLWGSSSGQLFLTVWFVCGSFDWPTWLSWIATFAALSMFQPFWHNMYWDHFIAPEHDTPMTQKIKVSCCHIPNLLIMLTHLALFNNPWIFLLAQLIACTSAAIAMRFPAPWAAASELNLAQRTSEFPRRCTGYLSDDYLSDPYTPFYPGWKQKGPAK